VSAQGSSIPRVTPYAQRVTREGEALIRTDFGEFRFLGYRDAGGLEHLAVLQGDVRGEAVLCRVHSECLTGEVFHSRRCECGAQLDLALQRIAACGRGVLVYLRQEGRGIGLLNKIRAYALQDQGADTVEANLALGFAGDLRSYGVAAEILRDLGVASVLLLSNNPDKARGLQTAGIDVQQRLPHVAGVHAENAAYLRTKRSRMGHDYPEGALGGGGDPPLGADEGVDEGSGEGSEEGSEEG
jgi:3,4-dihydroxy 2-butanone 4-phosphate synthase/GTP cyclohydrolase II